MVQLLEDQILRGKDPALRTDLARKVARLWEEKLADAREAADAWRRVLRMKSGDPEATEGLDRAKSNMLNRSASDAASLPPDSAPSATDLDAGEVPLSELGPKKAGTPVRPLASTPARSAGAKVPLMNEEDQESSSDDKSDLEILRRDTLTSSNIADAEGENEAIGIKELYEDLPSGIDVHIDSDSAGKSGHSSAERTKSPPAPPRKRVESSDGRPTKSEGSAPHAAPQPIGHSPNAAMPSAAPARRPPPPPPMRSSARPPPPVPPTKGMPARMPPPPPSLRPNVPSAPPSQVRPAVPPTRPPIEVNEADEEGISVNDSELLE